MTNRTEPESATATQWTYGTSAAAHNIGRLQQVTKPDGYAESYVYDSIGRPQTATYTVDGTNYAFDYAYNAYGTVDTITYPTSTSGVRFTLKNVYDSYGYLSQVKDNSAGTVFWSLSNANDASLPTSEVLGNGATVATSYTPWTNEMTARQVGTGGVANSLQDLAYQWDLTGNLHQRQDKKQSLTEVFGYDSMNRLKTSTLNGVNNLTMAYDAAGNITNKSDVSASNYVYGDTAHKHAVTSAGSWSMTYDANGNMITRAGGSITWYSYNLPNTISYSGNSTQFFYNANHQRWKQVANYGGTVETTRYVGGMLEVMTRGSVTEYRHQIPAGSSTVVYTRRTNGTNSTYYATSDHLGSSDLVLDSAATIMAKESFTPYGARRGSNWQGVPTTADYTAFSNTTRKGFTGHEMLDSVSLVHMNGRVYDPYLGRFLSADTAIQSLGASASINPFAYAWNNPLRYVDPSGHSLFGDILGAIVGVLIAVFLPGALDAYLTAIYGAGLTAASMAMVCGFVGGFVGALIATGDLSAALTAGLISGVTAGLFAKIGDIAGKAGSNWTKADRVLAHAAVGCGSGVASGGNCGRGALSAALSEAAVQGNWIKPAALGTWGSFKGAAEAGLLGGATAEITGGKFQDGYTVAAAGYLFNCALHYKPQSQASVLNGAVDIDNPDGSMEVRSGGSLSWRDNNPGNIEAGPFASSNGAIGNNGRFAIFPDEATGTDAVTSLLGTSSYQSLTVDQAVARWAPPTENNSASYASYVSGQLGVSGNTVMSTLSSQQIQTFVGAIKQYEGWQPGVSISIPALNVRYPGP